MYLFIHLIGLVRLDPVSFAALNNNDASKCVRAKSLFILSFSSWLNVPVWDQPMKLCQAMHDATPDKIHFSRQLLGEKECIKLRRISAKSTKNITRKKRKEKKRKEDKRMRKKPAERYDTDCSWV